eukprot:GHVU01171021.1.p2 GENE.GHVU01171021.1~~GHVU01171021.1.p2  ORF type:complete len:148 (-),score=15.40 GHVU01171021.1:534-977(-)
MRALPPWNHIGVEFYRVFHCLHSDLLHKYSIELNCSGIFLSTLPQADVIVRQRISNEHPHFNRIKGKLLNHMEARRIGEVFLEESYHNTGSMITLKPNTDGSDLELAYVPVSNHDQLEAALAAVVQKQSRKPLYQCSAPSTIRGEKS